MMMSRRWFGAVPAGLVVALCVSGCGPQVVTVPSAPAPTPTSAPLIPGATSTPSPSSPTVAPVSARWVPAAQVATTAARLINTARHTVDVEMYELGNPALVGALILAAHRGVQVRVILDATESQSVAAAPILRAGGVQVETVTVPRGGIDHVKLLVVDGTTTLTGGVNWGSGSSDTTDADVLLSTDPAAAQTFADDWTTAPGHPTSGAWPDPSGPDALSGTAIQREMVSLIQQASVPIDVAANYLTNYTIQDALAAAAARGIPVHVVINASAYGATPATAWLTSHGVSVRSAPAEPYLHAKILLAGDTGIIGSANFSYDALSARNHEFDVVLPAAVIPSAHAWFNTLWAASQPAS